MDRRDIQTSGSPSCEGHEITKNFLAFFNDDNTTLKFQGFQKFVAIAFLNHNRMVLKFNVILESPAFLAKAEIFGTSPIASRTHVLGCIQLIVVSTMDIRSTSTIKGCHMIFERQVNSVHPSFGG